MEIIAYSLFAASIHYGFGRQASLITPQQRVKILQLQFAFRAAGPCAATFARLSTVYQLIKLSPSVVWKRFLWVIVGLLVASFLADELFGLLQCFPLSAAWDHTIPNSRCVHPRNRWII